jgi:hypothetical protein
MDSIGNAITVWRRYDESNYRIQAKRYDVVTNTWPITATYLSEAGQDASDAQVTMNPAGNAMAVWRRYDGTNYRIQAKRYDGSTNTWQITAINLSAAGQNADVPQVAINSAGEAATVWIRNNGTDDIAQGILFDLPLLAPTNLTAGKKSHRFPSQTDLIHCLSWNSVENAEGYRIYLDTGIGKLINAGGDLFLGVLVAESVVSTNTSVEVHGRCSGFLYTYNVVAVDKYGDDGLFASVTI